MSSRVLQFPVVGHAHKKIVMESCHHKGKLTYKRTTKGGGGKYKDKGHIQGGSLKKFAEFELELAQIKELEKKRVKVSCWPARTPQHKAPRNTRHVFDHAVSCTAVVPQSKHEFEDYFEKVAEAVGTGHHVAEPAKANFNLKEKRPEKFTVKVSG
jgi:hypothetical protein